MAMEPLFDPTQQKSPAQVRAEYAAAESPRQWLEREVADFFAQPATSSEERQELAESILEADSTAFSEFIETEFEEHDLVTLTITIADQHSKRETLAAFPGLPSPTSLLWACCQVAEPGNVVSVIHRFATGVEISMSAVWPFGMQEAVAMTTPDPEELADMYEDDEDEEDDETSGNSTTLVASAHQVAVAALGLIALGVVLARLVPSRRPRR